MSNTFGTDILIQAKDPMKAARFYVKELGFEITDPRGSVQKRPTGVRSKPANGSGPELLEVVPDRELSHQGKSGLFPESAKKITFRSPQPRFLKVTHGSGYGFSGASFSCSC